MILSYQLDNRHTLMWIFCPQNIRASRRRWKHEEEMRKTFGDTGEKVILPFRYHKMGFTALY